MERVIIVGDRFAEFARNKAVVTVSDLEARLGQGECTDGEVFELGQGVSPDRVDNLVRLADAQGRRGQLHFSPVAKCGTEQVHKLRPENSLLSIPVRKDEETFESELLLDDRCDLLIDHLGGQHLPGMVLIEAVRQMGLAVIELFFAKQFPNGCGFLWTSLQVDFTQYAFPVRTILTVRVHERRVVRIRREAFSLDFACVQRGTVVATSRTAVELYDRRVVERQEKGLAAAASAAELVARAHAE